MKGVMNGTLHFSVLDGWWVEGYRKDAGWALPAERTYDVQDFQDELDAETIYNILEEEVISTFYERNKEGIPVEWVDTIKNTIAQVAPQFTTGRMMQDYHDRYYLPQLKRSKNIQNENFKWAKELAAWKLRVASVWDQIEVIKTEAEGVNNLMTVGQEYPVKVEVDLKGLSNEDVGLELIVAENGVEDTPEIVERLNFDVESCENSICRFNLNYRPLLPGSFNYGFRLYPKNDGLPHRQDFRYVKWL
jgi:glycogen phosphorylase